MPLVQRYMAISSLALRDRGSGAVGTAATREARKRAPDRGVVSEGNIV